jgi:hypothetical protein
MKGAVVRLRPTALLAAALCWTGAPAVCADPGDAHLRLVRSALLYSLTKFVEWPGDGGALVVCALGDAEFDAVLRQNLADRRVGDRPIDVQEVRAVAELAGCDLVFVGDDARERFDQVRRAVAGKGVLTVGGYPGFIDAGGVAGFVPQGENQSLELNLGAARAQGLKLDSRLLRIAGRVIGTRAAEEP